MAESKSKKKSRPVAASSNVLQTPEEPKNKVKLGFGIAFLLAGAFTSFSVISYFFTWQADQDKLSARKDTMDFLLHEDSIITNWGGRLGAWLSHVLVYQGVGIVALAIGLWIALCGLYMIYGKRITGLAKYLRWLCLLLLLAAPLLTFALPDNAFPWGGAWGNESIVYMNALVGRMGTGLGLLGLIAFVAFVIFSLDIRPLLRRTRRKVNDRVAAITATDTTPERAPEPEPEVVVAPPVPLATAAAEGLSYNDLYAQQQDAAPMVMQEQEEAASEEELNMVLHNLEEEEEDAEEEPLPELTPEQEPEPENETTINFDIPEKAVKKQLSNEEPEFSFEVVQQEVKTIPVPHNAHISVQDNEPYAPELDLPNYKFPTLDLLEDRAMESIALDKEELEKNKNQIIQTLRSFGIEIQRISATVGPTVTLYEIVPAEGVRISKIRNLEDDIALNLAALGIRIVAPIPGRGTIGIEVPNVNKQIVSMRALLSSEKFVNNKMSLPIALGKKIDNDNYIVDLATMPHLLMAGATGQGKSVGINAVLVSLLYKKHPSQLKFVMVDPKKVELSIYKVIEKHFLAKLPNEEEAIITDTKKVINTLNALCIEMDNRYELLKEAGTRNIKEYNEKFISRRLNPEKGHKYLPFIVLVVDEFADLIMTAGKEVEMPIARLAQLARAVGIHLIVATQRPSVNVITGTIKANFPARIAFKVSAKVDSRTILDAGGAEQLVGRGDLLISHGSELLRLQCAFVDTPEVEKIVEFIGSQRGYPYAFELPEYEGEEGSSGKVLDIGNRDELFEDCARLVVQSQSGSTSNLQRRFNLGYNRAGRIMDQLEAGGIVGPSMGSKPREVYVKTEAELETYL